MEDIGSAITDAARQLLETLMHYLPSLAGAAVLLALGWILARVARSLVARGLQVLEALLQRASGRAVSAGLRGFATAISTLIFWFVLLFFILAAAQVLGLATLTQWFARLLEYLPTLVAGLLIVAAGFILARFVGDLVYAAAERVAAAQRTTLARIARVGTLFAALLVGADQIGIRVTWIAILAVIAVTSVAGGVVLMVSLGARDHVSNLIGAHYLRQTLRIGESVRVRGHEGRVLDITATSLVLECSEGRVALPGRIFHEEAMVIIARSGDD